MSSSAAAAWFSFNEQENPSHWFYRHRGLVFAVATALKRYKRHDVIFPTILSSICLSLPPSLISLFLFSSLPNAISLDWIAPGHWPQLPCGAVSSPHPLFLFPLLPIPLEWKWADWCPAILYRSAAFPYQLVASAMPYSKINQWPPACMLIALSEIENTFTDYRPTPTTDSNTQI